MQRGEAMLAVLPRLMLFCAGLLHLGFPACVYFVLGGHCFSSLLFRLLTPSGLRFGCFLSPPAALLSDCVLMRSLFLQAWTFVSIGSRTDEMVSGRLEGRA